MLNLDVTLFSMASAPILVQSLGTSKAKLCRTDPYHSQASWQSSPRSLGNTLGKSAGVRESKHRVPVNQPLPSLKGCDCDFTMECSFTDRFLLHLRYILTRKMLESQAVKGLEETCQALFFKSLLGKGLTELNAIPRSDRLSTQRD